MFFLYILLALFCQYRFMFPVFLSCNNLWIKEIKKNNGGIMIRIIILWVISDGLRWYIYLFKVFNYMYIYKDDLKQNRTKGIWTILLIIFIQFESHESPRIKINKTNNNNHHHHHHHHHPLPKKDDFEILRDAKHNSFRLVIFWIVTKISIMSSSSSPPSHMGL